MKIAKVEHSRCQEHDCNTFVWIPDTMGQEDFDMLVRSAMRSYLDAEAALKDFPGKPFDPGYSPNYKRYPDKKISEVEEIHNKQKEEFKVWKVKADAARKSFADHLVTVSGGTIKYFFDGEFSIIADADWGHRHGVTIIYGETDVAGKDLNSWKRQHPDGDGL